MPVSLKAGSIGKKTLAVAPFSELVYAVTNAWIGWWGCQFVFGSVYGILPGI